MITAGSVRGKTSAPLSGSRCTHPARSIVVRAPVIGEKRLRSCHSTMPMACASRPASRSPSWAPTSRSPAQESTGRPPMLSERGARSAA